MQHPADAVRDALRSAVRDAMRAGDRRAIAALRAGLSAIDQAEAVAPDGHEPTIGALGEVPRRRLTADDVRRALLAEADERRTAIDTLRAVGRDEAADDVARELEVLLAHLPADPHPDLG